VLTHFSLIIYYYKKTTIKRWSYKCVYELTIHRMNSSENYRTQDEISNINWISGSRLAIYMISKYLYIPIIYIYIDTK